MCLFIVTLCVFSFHSIITVHPFITASNDTELYFVHNPKSVYVVAGKNTTLSCEINSSETTEGSVILSWMLNGEPVVNTTRRYTWQKDTISFLHITRADRELDAGSFTCVARYTEDRINATLLSSMEAEINILWLGDAVVQLQTPLLPSLIKPNEEVILRCNVDGSGDINISWYRNMELITENQHIIIKKKRLHIKQSLPKYNGVYKCKAENEAGFVWSTSGFPLIIPDDSTPLIEVVPRDILVKEHDTAYFDCVYKNADVVHWYFEKTDIFENTTKYYVLDNNTLIIEDSNKSDEGVYSCLGIRNDSTAATQTYSALLQIAYLQELSKDSFEPKIDTLTGIIAEGDEFQITCLPPQGLPKPRIWWKNPENHTISDTGSVRVDNSRLIISNARYKTDSGNYTCVAENKAGITEISFYLAVTKKPIIIQHPKSLELNEGDLIELNCKYEGTELPINITRIQWYRNERIISEVQDNRIKIFPYNGTLLINSVIISDQGQYKCEVQTKAQAPVQSNMATVSVIEKLKFSPPPVNKKLELGTTAKIHCKAQGGVYGSPVIKWYKIRGTSTGSESGEEGGNTTMQDEFPSHVEDINGTLLFNNVRNEDAGTYTCIAKDGEEVINATIQVDVVVAPKFSIAPENPTEALEGSSVMIHCVVEGDPKPTIQWDKNLRMNDFDHNRFQVLENGSLYIKDIHMDDENSYGCTAGNSAGLNRKETKLLVKPDENYRTENYNNENDGVVITKAVLITTGVAAAYMVLVVGLMLWCRYRRRSRKSPLNVDDERNEDETQEQTEEKAVGELTCGQSEITKAEKKKSSQSNGEAHKSDSADTAYSQSSNQSKKSKSNYDKFQISRECFKDIVQIGRGEFGDIMIAKMIAGKRASLSENSSEPQLVMIKSLTESKDESILTEFKRQIDLFSKKQHENVAKLIGLSREIEPHYMILEYTDWGDLKRFLIATKKASTEKSPPPLTVKQIVSIAYQLSRGAEHIADQRLVHKDIAARNCLITSQLTAKLSLAGLTKDVYREEYCKHVNQVIPLRWMPYEAVYEDDYSTKSDVWSWACLVWEIFNQGDLPFSDQSDSSVLTHLKDNTLKWKAHKATPPALVELLDNCWLQNPGERPTFTVIVQKMTEIMDTL